MRARSMGVAAWSVTAWALVGSSVLAAVPASRADDAAPESRAAGAAPPLAFRIDSGDEINAFVRRGEVAAHLVLRSGTSPRLLVAFPAGDSGVAVWFASGRAVTWTLLGSPRPIVLADSKGRPLRGIEAEATVDASELRIRQALLSSVRVLRNYTSGAPVPAMLLAPALASGRRIVWERDRLDGAAGYRLSIELLEDGAASPRALTSGASGRLHVRIVAATGEHPLTPLGGHALLASTAPRDAREREVLEFLSYREKYLAGSWRYDTYFGRDTLMSLMLLAPVLQPQAMQSGLRSVLARLAPDGKVAHEEAIGEYAILENAAAGRGPTAAPVYDYGMIDESFELAPVAARWLLDCPAGRARAAEFLSSRGEAGERSGAALARNLLWIVKRAAAFADRPAWPQLIGLEPRHDAGDWRDSREGLAGGRYPYDVNAVFVPAALDAADRLVRSGLLDPYLTPAQRQALRRAGAEQRVWLLRAPPLFVVRIPAADARRELSSYAHAIGVDVGPALESTDARPVAFDALALTAAGRPIPVMNSDVGFALLFESPPAADIERMLAILRPFPAGLVTPVGVVVADPAYAGRAVQSLLTNTAYHGAVIWSWQQAVLEAGLDRQLARHDLPLALHSRLAAARARIGSLVAATAPYRTLELWSWSFSDGRYRMEPFEAQGRQVEEADAAQLWSTVFLALGAQG